MSDMDHPIRASRRAGLRVSAVAVPGVALAGAGICATASWAVDAKHLNPHAMATLVLLARDIYPHDRIADLVYVRAITPWDAKAGADPAIRTLLLDGVAALDAAAVERHGSDYLGLPAESDRTDLLRDIEPTRFFSAIRADLVVALYSQSESWPRFNGVAVRQRGHDIDWLPTT